MPRIHTLQRGGSSCADDPLRSPTQGGGVVATGEQSTPAYVNHATAYNAACTLNGITLGNFLVAWVSGGAGTASITTTSGNTSSWTEAGTLTESGATGTMFWAIKTVDTGNVTVTASGLTDLGTALHEYSGVAATTPQDGSAVTDQASGAGDTSVATSAISPATDKTLFVVGYFDESALSSYTTAFTKRSDQNDHTHATFDKVITSKADTSFTATLNAGSSSWGCVMAAFKGASE